MIAVAADVAWVDQDDLPGELPGEPSGRAVYVARLPDGVPLVLEDSAWAVWRAITDGACDLDAITAAAAALLGSPVTPAVRADVSAFLDRLLSSGLVVA